MNIIFDLDGTLVDSGKPISDEMGNLLKKISNFNVIYHIVGGGTYEKIKSQLKEYINLFDCIFSESGSCLHRKDNLIYEHNMMDHIDKKLVNSIIKQFLIEIIKYDIIYAGHLIDRRKGAYYLSLVGIQADDFERNDFIIKDKELNIRQTVIKELKKIDVDNCLDIRIGGNTGLSLTPIGWNKARVINFFKNDDILIFFGDRTEPDGNDYPLYSHPRIIGYNVFDYHDTMKKLENLIES